MPSGRAWFTISANLLEHSIATQKIGIVTRITEQLADLTARIQAAAARAERDTASVQLLAASKTQPVETIRGAWNAGIRHFGENYVQEALTKIPEFDEELAWHFIGRIQSNKTRQIAAQFDWVHTLCDQHIAERLSRQRPDEAGELQICIQVRPLNAASRSLDHRGGIPEAKLPELASIVSNLPHLHLRGLMMMPLPDQTEELTRTEYARTRRAFHELRKSGYGLDTLSMGMSNDLEVAIMEGSTMLRIGTALFGPRDND
jgi:pyridoxal phosphate enzyme (YggS family)